MENIGFYGLWAAAGIFMVVYYIKRKHPFLAVLKGSLSGLAVLVLLHYLGGIIGFAPEMNLFNIMQAVLLGLPGMVLMTVMHFIC